MRLRRKVGENKPRPILTDSSTTMAFSGIANATACAIVALYAAQSRDSGRFGIDTGGVLDSSLEAPLSLVLIAKGGQPKRCQLGELKRWYRRNCAAAVYYLGRLNGYSI